MRFQSLDLNMGDNYVDKHRDTQLSLAEFDFFKPLYDIQKLSLCGLKMPLIEQQAKLNNEIAKLIEQKKISEALKYVDELDDIYNKEFIKLQLYAELSKDDVVGLYSKSCIIMNII